MNRLTRPLFASLAGLALVASLSRAQAQSKLYVAPNGDDSASGSLTAPFATMSKAVSLLKPGDTLFVRDGVYAESFVVSASGTSSDPIQIMAYPGETPIIDGQGRLPTRKEDPLVRLRGSYIHLDGLKIRNSTGGGVVLDGDHNVARHLNVHHNQQAGVLARGNYSIVEYSYIWQNAHLNCREADCPPSPYKDGMWATGLSAARNPADAMGITHHAILRHNIAANNWGEGISSYEADGTVMEDNVSYDNWATNYYISDSSNVLFQRNLAYITNGYKLGRNRDCITLADERKDKPRSHNNVVINNTCMNGALVAFQWSLVAGSGLVDDLIANNTILNGSLKVGGAESSSKIVNSNTRIVNNLITSSPEGTIASVVGGEGVKFSHNLWSTAPVDAALDPTSIVAKPMVAGPSVGGPGNVKMADFTPSPKSPARGAGLDLGKIVATDALGNPRSAHPTIGAIEILP
jgi:hypothetical protein